MTPDLTPQIERAADEVASVTVDGQTTTAVPIPDLIAAANYLRQLSASNATSPQTGKKRSGFSLLRPGLAQPPGTT